MIELKINKIEIIIFLFGFFFNFKFIKISIKISIDKFIKMTKILIPYLPPELLEIILSYSDSSTLQTCLDIAYLKNFIFH